MIYGRRGDNYDPVERSHLNTNKQLFLSNDDKLLENTPELDEEFYDTLPVHDNPPDSNSYQNDTSRLMPDQSPRMGGKNSSNRRGNLEYDENLSYENNSNLAETVESMMSMPIHDNDNETNNESGYSFDNQDNYGRNNRGKRRQFLVIP